MSEAHRPRRRFAQHFLTDPAMLDAMVARIAPRAGERLLEIGPGRGALTARLLERAPSLHAIEIDRDLNAELRRRFPGLVLIERDVLEVDFAALLGADGEPRWRIVGNLPYNISTPLLARLLAEAARVEDMHFLLQRELVERLAAEPGTKRWGRLSVLAQYHCEIEPLMRVPPECFRPRPRVDSSFVRLRPRAGAAALIDARALDAFDALLRAGFQQRRKTLRNAFKAFAIDWRSAPVAPELRPDQLDVAGYVALANRIAGTSER